MTSAPSRPVFSSNILADCTADEYSVSFKAMRIDVRRDGDSYAVSNTMIEVLYSGDIPLQPIPITAQSIGALMDESASGRGYVITSELIETVPDLTAAKVRARLVEDAYIGGQWDVLDHMPERVPDWRAQTTQHSLHLVPPAF